MQEKTRTEQLEEIRSFWKKQIQDWQESGLPYVVYQKTQPDSTASGHLLETKTGKKTTEAPVSLVQVNMIRVSFPTEIFQQIQQ